MTEAILCMIKEYKGVISRASIQGATYYLATNGNDSNPGTENLPWRTIQKAANILQASDIVYVKQ